METTNLARTLPLAAAAVLCACGGPAQLRPAPGARLVEGPGLAVAASDGGVELTAQVQAWDANPSDLEQVMSPLRVEIRNGSGRPLRIRHQDFALVEADGTRLTGIPPYNIDEQVVRTITPAYPFERFYLAPYLDDFYEMEVWADPFLYDEVYYDRVYPFWSSIQARVELPTDQMVELALPEGVLEPGGTVAGFLYFEDVEDDVGGARFQVELEDARTGELFGRIEIPFVVG